jgi:hypothetical protein
MFAVYFCIINSGLTSFVIFIVQCAHLGHYDGGTFATAYTLPRWLQCLEYYAKAMSVASLCLFLAWIEYLIWPWPQDEAFSQIGQWGQLVAILLVIFSALASQLRFSSRSPWRDLWRELFSRDQ